MSPILGWLWTFSLPAGPMLAIAAVAVLYPGLLPHAFDAMIPLVVLAVSGIGLLLALFFHRSRITFGLAVLAMTYYGLSWLVSHPNLAAVGPAFAAIACLAPINFIALGLTKERGVFTSKGLWWFLAIAVQALLVTSLANRGLIHGLSVDADLMQWTGWTRVPAIALLAHAGAVGLFAVRSVVQPNPVDRAFFWATLSLFGALHATSLHGTAIYITTAAAVLTVSVVQVSYLMAYHDELTGLPGRRSFNEAILRLGQEYTIAMVDVDHFKSFNDQYGHDVGDQVLRMVATRLSRVSGGGQAFRYGGEEFAVIFGGTSLEKALPHLEALRVAIGESRFALRRRWRPVKKPRRPRPAKRLPRSVSVTVSIGAAGAKPGIEPERVIQAADRALYRAKDAGRNVVVSGRT